jgi:hypothetical protein
MAQDAGMGKTEAQQEKYHMDIGERSSVAERYHSFTQTVSV